MDSSGGFVKSLFQLAYDRRLKAIEGSWLGAWGLEKLLWDVLVFKKIQAILGGNIRGMLSGGAPLSRDTQRFINICFGYDVGLCKIDFSRLMESLQSVFTILGVGATDALSLLQMLWKSSWGFVFGTQNHLSF